MSESKTAAYYILNYWHVGTGIAAFAGILFEAKWRLRQNTQEIANVNAKVKEVDVKIDKVKEDADGKIEKVRGDVDETVKEIRADIAKVGDNLTENVNELRHDMREDQRETNSSVREILTILSKRGD